jgi:hypothetical protein
MHYSTITVPRSVVASGIGLLAVIGAIHLLYAQGYYAFVPYVGVLFYATAAAAALAAVGVVCGARKWGWTFGVLLAAAALAGYVLSRTIGLPLFPILPWQDPFGLAALVAEALFIVLGLIVLGAAPHVWAGDSRVSATEPRRIHKHDASVR